MGNYPLIARGACTFSKSPSQFIEGVYPKSISHYDPKHNRYIGDDGVDYINTVGALGAALRHDVDTIYSLPSSLEMELARVLKIRLRDKFDTFRFGINGRDATDAAIRYARAYTRKTQVYSVGYHGCDSGWTHNTPPAAGCVYGHITQFSNLHDALSMIDALTNCVCSPHDVAALIIEPLELEVRGRQAEVTRARELCTKKGIVLIFDEIITGMRVPHTFVSNWFEVTPDILCIGKAMGGGHPFSAVCGKGEILANDDVFVSYTFAGYKPGLQAALDLLKTYSDVDMQNFYDRANKFKSDFNDHKFSVKLQGYGTRCVWTGQQNDLALLWQHACRNGVLLGRAFFPAIDWSDEMYETLIRRLRFEMDLILAGVHKTLWGPLPKPAFVRKEQT